MKATSRPGHPRWSLALLVLGTILTFAAIFSIWVNRQALNTNNWVDTSTRLIQNEEVRSQLADYLANELFANADVAGELREALPPRLAPLATAAAGGLSSSPRRPPNGSSPPLGSRRSGKRQTAKPTKRCCKS